MVREILITGASQLVTLRGPARPRIKHEMRQLGIIEGGAVLIRNGKIAAVGTSSEIERFSSSEAEVIPATGRSVMPGFVDAHTHPVFAGTREDEYEMRSAGISYQEIAARGGGILSTVRRTRAASEDELLELALARARRFLEHGTTTIEAKSGYGLTTADELKILRVINRLSRETPLEVVPTFLGAHQIPEEFCGGSRGRYIELILEEMLPAVAASNLAQYCDVFCERGAFNLEESRLVLGRAKEAGLGIRVHAEQFSHCGGTRLAVELGAASADHLEYIDRQDIELLSRAGPVAILLPGATFNLGLARYAPARALIDGGAAVALATDFNPGSSPTFSMQMVLSIACSQMKMTPAEAITAATINAAHSLGLADRIGSIEEGKQADIAIFDCPDYRQIPYFYGINHAEIVIKNGQIVFQRA